PSAPRTRSKQASAVLQETTRNRLAAISTSVAFMEALLTAFRSGRMSNFSEPGDSSGRPRPRNPKTSRGLRYPRKTTVTLARLKTIHRVVHKHAIGARESAPERPPTGHRH